MSPEVVIARTLADALEAMGRATGQTRVLAGGTDLMVELHTGRTSPDRVVDIWGVPELRGIAAERGGLRIGALTTCSALQRDPLVRASADILWLAATEVGAEQIRNRATLGGNLGTASPAADLNPVLIALGAKVRLRSRQSTREVDAADFLCGYRRTLRRPDELIDSVWIPPRHPAERRTFRKVGTRRAQSIAKVVLAMAGAVEGGIVVALRAAAGSVAERTLPLATLADDLLGRGIDVAGIERAARNAAAAIRPIDDVRSTAVYRRQVLYRICRTALAEVLLPPSTPP